MAPPMSSEDVVNALDQLPDGERIRSRRLANGVATIVADATGLGSKDRDALEQRLKAAALAMPGVHDARVALTASKPGATNIDWLILFVPQSTRMYSRLSHARSVVFSSTTLFSSPVLGL